MHLKNFALLTLPDKTRQLSPAYDLLCTRLAIPEDGLALTIGGRNKRLTRRKWLDFGDYCGIPPKAVRRIMVSVGKILEVDSAIPERGR
jgi:serine/threonine-protein kinase HipA